MGRVLGAQQHLFNLVSASRWRWWPEAFTSSRLGPNRVTTLAPPLLRLPSTCTLNAFIFLNVPSLQRTTCWQLVTDRNENQKLIP